MQRGRFFCVHASSLVHIAVVAAPLVWPVLQLVPWQGAAFELIQTWSSQRSPSMLALQSAFVSHCVPDTLISAEQPDDPNRPINQHTMSESRTTSWLRIAPIPIAESLYAIDYG
jgi:hypothetical protein